MAPTLQIHLQQLKRDASILEAVYSPRLPRRIGRLTQHAVVPAVRVTRYGQRARAGMMLPHKSAATSQYLKVTLRLRIAARNNAECVLFGDRTGRLGVAHTLLGVLFGGKYGMGLQCTACHLFSCPFGVGFSQTPVHTCNMAALRGDACAE